MENKIKTNETGKENSGLTTSTSPGGRDGGLRGQDSLILMRSQGQGSHWWSPEGVSQVGEWKRAGSGAWRGECGYTSCGDEASCWKSLTLREKCVLFLLIIPYFPSFFSVLFIILYYFSSL